VEQSIATESEQVRDDGEAVAGGAMEAPVSPTTLLATPTTESTVESTDALLGLLDNTDAQRPEAAETTAPSAPVTNMETAGGAATPGSTTPDDAMITADQVSGEHFMDWLQRGIQSRKLIINDAKALVHTVADTVYLVSPGIFQRYAQEHPQTALLAKQDKVADWQWIQKRFEKLHLHRKQDDGLNIWTCEVTGPRKSRRLHGHLLEDPQRLFDDVPPNNPYLSIVR
jgi:hypothetical protein